MPPLFIHPLFAFLLAGWCRSAVLLGETSPLMMFRIGSTENGSIVNEPQRQKKIAFSEEHSDVSSSARRNDPVAVIETNQELSPQKQSSRSSIVFDIVPPLKITSAVKCFIGTKAQMTCGSESHEAASAAHDYLAGDQSPWRALSDKERSHYNNSILSELVHSFQTDEAHRKLVKPSLPAKVMEILSLQHQHLLTLARSQEAVAENLERELHKYCYDFSEEDKDPNYFQQKLTPAITTVEQCLSAWKELELFLKNFALIAPQRRTTIIRTVSLPGAQNSIRGWEARREHFNLLRIEEQVSRLLSKINKVQECNLNESTYEQAKRLFSQRKRKIVEIHNECDFLTSCYQSGLNQSPPNQQKWWCSRLIECQHKQLYWKMDSLKNDALRRELSSDTAKQTAFDYFKTLSSDFSDKGSIIDATAFLEQAFKKIEEEKVAWSNLEKECLAITQKQNVNIEPILEENLAIAQQKQLILEADLQEMKARKIGIELDLAYHEILQIQNKKDPLYQQKRIAVELTAEAQKTAWDNLKQFYKQSAPQASLLDTSWNRSLIAAEEEFFRSQWNYFKFKKDDAIAAVKFHEKYRSHSMTSYEFYSQLIKYSQRVVSCCKELFSIYQDRLISLPQFTEENEEYLMELHKWWQEQYAEILLVEQEWNNSIYQWQFYRLRNSLPNSVL